MDPLAHTLVGATLARTSLGTRRPHEGPYRAATLILAANLPDIDVLTYAGGADTALLLRRGITHGPLGLLLLPPLLVAGILLWRRWRHRSALGRAGRLPVGTLLALAYLGAVTHPLLDWLNTYGVRLLSPWSDRWFYGDVLFIVDPWLWLILGAGLYLGSARSRRGAGLWLALALITTLPIALAPIGPWAKALWMLSLVAIASGRRFLSDSLPGRSGRLAVTALLLGLLYLGLMITSARAARQLTLSELRERPALGPIEDVMVGPLPATLFERDVVVELGEHYRFGRFSWFPARRLQLDEREIPKLDPEREGTSNATGNFITTALADPSIEGFVHWMRFPYVEVKKTADGAEVFLIDARYLRRRPRGPQDFGGASVVVPSGD